MEQQPTDGYTSLEQSKLLVSLGVDPYTADMHHYIVGDEYCYTSWHYYDNDMSISDGYIPCWSLNALVNMFPTGENAPVFTLTRCGTDIATEQHNSDWYAEWESDDTYLVFNDPTTVGAVVKLLVKLIQDKRIKL